MKKKTYLIGLSIGLLLRIASAHAELGLAFDEKSELFVMQYQSDKVDFELESRNPVFPIYYTPTACNTLGSRMLDRARSIERSSSATMAQLNLANLWLGNVCNGKSDVKPNGKEVIAWLEFNASPKTFDTASLYSHTLLMQAYLLGGSRTQPNYKKALQFLASEVDLHPELAGHYFAYMNKNGLGVKKSDALSADWIRRAAPPHEQLQTPLLNLVAGVLHAQAVELGQGETRDAVHAFQDYSRLARAGSESAKYRLGMMYLDGRGTAVDVCQAKYFLEAVQSDSAASRRASVALQRIAADGTCPDSTSEEMTMLTLPEYAVQREYQRSMISKRSVTFELPGNRRKADVEAVFEQNRKALYLPYARALHDDKTLQGKVQFEMTISPAGEVVACKVISTTMNHPQLEERLVNAIRSIRFPAAYVFPLTLTKPIEFFPSN